MYKWNPEEYRSHPFFKRAWGIDLLSKIKFKGDERVLDIGCGNGELTFLIAREVPQGFVIGIDDSEIMIKSANDNFPYEKYQNLIFIKNNIVSFDSKEEFDLVFSNLYLHWLANHISILKKISGNLKTSGRLLFQMYGKGNASEVQQIIRDIIRRRRWDKYYLRLPFPYSFYGTEEYTKWLNLSGFKIKRIGLTYDDMVYKEKEEYESWINADWNPYISRLPEKLRTEFVNELVDNSFNNEKIIDDNGHIHIEMIRLQVEAVK